MQQSPTTAAASTPRGQTVPYPELDAQYTAKADQRHARVRQVAGEIIEAAAATVEGGYDARDGGVHLQFTSEQVHHALDRILAGDKCSCGSCFVPAALLLIGELALRAGNALAIGRRQPAALGNPR